MTYVAHDESDYARRIATQYGTDHTEIRLSAEQVIEATKEAVLSMDLPSVDAINTYIVAKEVAQRSALRRVTGSPYDVSHKLTLTGGTALARRC